eukprot:802885-Pelagomonas_calceolata.AAC.1
MPHSLRPTLLGQHLHGQLRRVSGLVISRRTDHAEDDIQAGALVITLRALRRLPAAPSTASASVAPPPGCWGCSRSWQGCPPCPSCWPAHCVNLRSLNLAREGHVHTLKDGTKMRKITLLVEPPPPFSFSFKNSLVPSALASMFLPCAYNYQHQTYQPNFVAAGQFI